MPASPYVSAKPTRRGRNFCRFRFEDRQLPAPSLGDEKPHQPSARDPVGKAGIIFNALDMAGLAAEIGPLQEKAAPAGPSQIHSRRKPRGASPDDHDVHHKLKASACHAVSTMDATKRPLILNMEEMLHYQMREVPV